MTKILSGIVTVMLFLIITGFSGSERNSQAGGNEFCLIESDNGTDGTEKIQNSLDNDVYFNTLHDRRAYLQVLLSGLSRTINNPFIREIFQPPKAA